MSGQGSGEGTERARPAELAALCGSVVHNHSADAPQANAGHKLRMEWVRLTVTQVEDPAEAENSLRKRMVEFLPAIPPWTCLVAFR